MYGSQLATSSVLVSHHYWEDIPFPSRHDLTSVQRNGCRREGGHKRKRFTWGSGHAGQNNSQQQSEHRGCEPKYSVFCQTCATCVTCLTVCRLQPSMYSVSKAYGFPKQSEHHIREKLGIKPPTASSKLLSQEKPIRMPKDWIRARLNSIRSLIRWLLFFEFANATCWQASLNWNFAITELTHWIDSLNCCRVQSREVSTSSSVKSMSASLSRTFQLLEGPANCWSSIHANSEIELGTKISNKARHVTTS